MKRKLLEYLCCPDCAGQLELTEVLATEANEIIQGRLGCITCKSVFPIVRGVPRFVSRDLLEADKAATAASPINHARILTLLPGAQQPASVGGLLRYGSLQ